MLVGEVHVNFWPPFTAIRSGELNGNDNTPGEPGWSPLFTTPQHPDTVRTCDQQRRNGVDPDPAVGDDPGVPFVPTSPTNPGFVRHWATFSDGVEEVVDARVYSGFHYRTSDETGAKLGRKVARFVMNHALAPEHCGDKSKGNDKK